MDMEKLKAWWAGVERERQFMLAALALSLLSQFFLYRTASGGGGFLTHATDTDYYTGHVFFAGMSAATGWQLHPYAILVLPGLAYVYASKVHLNAWWSRWGWWLSAALIFLCSGGEVFNALGAFAGIVAFGLSLWAAWRHHKAGQGLLPPPDA